MDALLFHPKVVHVPIALAVLMPLITGGILLAWWRHWLPSRAWVLVVALQAAMCASALVAMRTGEQEEDRVERVVAEHFIEAHEDAAKTFVGGSVAVLALMLIALAAQRRKAALPTALAATLGSVMVLALGYRAGDAGGDLVYRHGAANAHVDASSGQVPSVPERGESHDDDDD